MKLTEEQKNVIHGVLDNIKSGKQIIKVSGFAGTGKSTIVYNLYHALPNSAVCAFTGKAADVLRKKHIPATTIHSLIYKPIMEDGKPKKDKHGNPIFAKTETLEADQIIVDEASMISRDLYEDLVSFNRPIIFVGDHGQLEPVGADINLMQYPDFILEQIHRNAGEIAHFCSWIRQGYKPAAFARYIREGKVLFINKFQVEPYYTKADQIICAFNKTRMEVNYKTRFALGFTDFKKPQKNDRVMCLKNNSRIGLFNGMQGVITYLYKNNRFIFKTEDKTFDIIYDPSQFGRESYDISGGKDDPDPFDWCFAITLHKAQGSEWPIVLVKEQKSRNWDHSRWAYTAASRAKDLLIWEVY